LQIGLGGVEQDLGWALGGEAPQLAVVPGGRPDLATRGGDPPHRRRADVADQLQGGGDGHAAIGVDRHRVGVALEEVGLGRDDPEPGAGGVQRTGAGEHDRPKGTADGPQPRPRERSGNEHGGQWALVTTVR
jgi:hypothetical protein